MGKRVYITFVLLLCAAGVGCVKDPTSDVLPETEGNVWVTLDFGDSSFRDVKIETRSAAADYLECRVSNLYVFLFNAAGQRLYGYYFSSNNKASSDEQFRTSMTDIWRVNNWLKEGDPATYGSVRMYVPSLSGGGKIYLIANIDADMVDISPESLNYVDEESELLALMASLNQDVTSRNGAFPMSGAKEDIAVTASGITASGSSDFRIPLTRLDARVEVRFRAAKGYRSVNRDETSGETTTQVVGAFRPESWQVVNLPRGCRIMPADEDCATEYWTSDTAMFDESNATDFTYDFINDLGEKESVSVTSDEHLFTFYMLENRPTAKRSVAGDYHLRDRRTKSSSGAYDTSGDLWEYAPETATYLVVRGELDMEVDISSEAKSQTLAADVTYYIHLGDLNSSMDDYSVKRNTRYTYTILIKGVDNIQVEVQTETTENESGATGDVYVAKESIYTFDAHYGQRVFCFDQSYIEPETMTWYVKTPFGREGVPDVVNGTEIPDALDYKWVHFMVNDTYTDSGQLETKNPTTLERYSHRNMAYHPDKVIDVLEFVRWIKEQKRLFAAQREAYPDDWTKWSEGNAFRPEIDTAWREKYPRDPEQYIRWRIYVTIFVDEFYYDSHPMSGDTRSDLWKTFVNTPGGQAFRIMHILSDSNFSADGDSSMTGSVVTIRQRTIQTIYNPDNPDLMTAWGTETVDETDGLLFFFSRRENFAGSPPAEALWNMPSTTSQYDGLYNSVRMWGLMSDNTWKTCYWSDFLTYERENDHPLCFLRNDDYIATARYSCLMRNRDNNGNGVIDADEIRWYLASRRQLAELYVGDQGISSEAQLYPRSRGNESSDSVNLITVVYDDADGTVKAQIDNGSYFPWRSHVISSTWNGSGSSARPIVMWAEEGVSTSDYGIRYKKYAPYSVRCVRNLGIDPASAAEAEAALRTEDAIDQAIKMTEPEAGVYRFDLSRLNPKSTRFYTTHELEPSDEHSEAARPYSGFETGVSMSGTNYGALYANLIADNSPCPTGYRLPNIREGAIMTQMITDSSWWVNSDYFYLVSTYFSLGTMGSNTKDNVTSWGYRSSHITLSPSYPQIRCVRDC